MQQRAAKLEGHHEHDEQHHATLEPHNRVVVMVRVRVISRHECSNLRDQQQRESQQHGFARRQHCTTLQRRHLYVVPLPALHNKITGCHLRSWCWQMATKMPNSDFRPLLWNRKICGTLSEILSEAILHNSSSTKPIATTQMPAKPVHLKNPRYETCCRDNSRERSPMLNSGL